jgi:GNAT superfamily N-acetyltransferase
LASERTVTLPGGERIVVRPIRPADKQSLEEGFERLSEESRYLRFFTPMARLAPAQLRYLTEVDHHDHEALVAFAEDGTGVGVARYVRIGEGVAEAAVAVTDDWHGRGVATALLQLLAARAREEGIERFAATMLAHNTEAVELFRRLGNGTVERSEPGVVEVRVLLPASAQDADTPLRSALRAAASGHASARPPADQRSTS